MNTGSTNEESLTATERTRTTAQRDTNGTRKMVFRLLVIMCMVLTALWAERLYWAYWPFEPLKVYGIKIINPNETVCAGSNLLYEMDIDKRMDVPSKIKRQLVNSYIIDFPVLEPPDKPLGRQKVVTTLNVPAFADEGLYYLRWAVEYSIGPDKRLVTAHVESKPFLVRRCK